jgi:hypothetical protein
MQRTGYPDIGRPPSYRLACSVWLSGRCFDGVKFLWTLRPAFRSAWGIGVVAVFLHAAVDYPFSRPALAAWIVVAIALLADAGGRQQQIVSAPTEC